MDWTISRTIKPALVAFALYLVVAGYLKYAYVPQPDLPPRGYLAGPFINVGGFSYIAILPKEFKDTADSVDDVRRSPLQIYESEKPIGPAHSVHADIKNLGGGRYSHWRWSEKDWALFFSATDNSDPNNNGKRYSYLKGNRAYLSVPFTKLSGFSYFAPLPGDLADSADSLDNRTRSSFQLYENDKLIGPAHSTHLDISNLGGGRYSHWRLDKRAGLIFSASDNSDPNNNGKLYSYPRP